MLLIWEKKMVNEIKDATVVSMGAKYG